MSTLRVNKLENTNTSNGGISIDTSGHVSIDGQQLPSSGPLSNRNLVINGAMQVAQRGTSQAGISSSDYWTVDRWLYGIHGSPSFVSTMGQSTDGPVGFSNSLRIDITTAQASLGTSDAQWFDYRTEAQDCQVLNFGTSDAKSFTLSFWVKSNKTGTYVVWIMNHDGNTASSSTYTIDAADTWEYKTLTFAGDTSQAIANDNGIGLLLRFVQAAGTGYTSGTASAGFSANNMTDANRYVGLNVNIADSTDNDWSITGVQLEVGETATPFEHRSYGDELVKCQRYYQVIGNVASDLIGIFSKYSTNNNYIFIDLPVEMRVQPQLHTNISSYSNALRFMGSGTNAEGNNLTLDGDSSPRRLRLNSSIDSGSFSVGSSGWARIHNSLAYVNVTAEL